MANRFCDTEIWNKDWYLDLSIKQKLLVKYLFDSCDCAGFFHISWNKLKFFIGEEITKQDLLAIKQVKFINDNLIFIEDFIFFQYKIKSLNELNPKNNAHKGVIKRLEEFSPSLAPTQPLKSPIDGVIGNRIKEEGNNRIINIEEKKENLTKEKKEIPLENFDFVSKPIEPFCNSQIEECIEIYKTTCVDLCKLTGFERRDLKTRTKISEFLSAIGCDMDYYRRLCVEANRLKYIANSLIDISSMVNNHIGIMNGKYVKQIVENEQQSKFIKDYEKLLEL